MSARSQGELAYRTELLDPRVPTVRDVDVPGLIECDSSRVVELTRIAPRPAPPGQHLAVTPQHLSLTSRCVGDIDVAAGVGGHTDGLKQSVGSRNAAPHRGRVALGQAG